MFCIVMYVAFVFQSSIPSSSGIEIQASLHISMCCFALVPEYLFTAPHRKSLHALFVICFFDFTVALKKKDKMYI